jgi:hypothetical protein
MIDEKITIAIFGHFSFIHEPTRYLKLLLFSLPDELKKCKFLFVYDSNETDESQDDKNGTFLRFLKTQDLNYEIYYSNYGLYESLGIALDHIKTEYFIFLEHDFVFLQKDRINFNGLINTFDNYSFVNAVWFNFEKNIKQDCDYFKHDIYLNPTYYGKEEKIKDFSLINTTRFSNRPCMYRVSKYKEWYKNYIENFYCSEYVAEPINEKIHQGSNGVEEIIINVIRKDVSINNYSDIRYKWGLYLYGNEGDEPYVAHIDGTKKKFNNENKTIAEYNGEWFEEVNLWVLKEQN